MDSLNFAHPRFRRAQAGAKMGKNAYGVCWTIAIILAVSAALIIFTGVHLGYSLAGVAIIFLMVALWYKHDLATVAVTGQGINDRLDVAVLKLLKPQKEAYTPATLWQAIRGNWQAMFFCNHLLVPPELIANSLATIHDDLSVVFGTAAQLADETKCAAIEAGHLTAALMLTSPAIIDYLRAAKLSIDDVRAVMTWLGRDLEAMRRPKPSFGGIGRDWASGFTPLLDRF